MVYVTVSVDFTLDGGIADLFGCRRIFPIGCTFRLRLEMAFDVWYALAAGSVESVLLHNVYGSYSDLWGCRFFGNVEPTSTTAIPSLEPRVPAQGFVGRGYDWTANLAN